LQDNPLENLRTAFDIAERHCNIPRMLVAEGWSACIVETPDTVLTEHVDFVLKFVNYTFSALRLLV